KLLAEMWPRVFFIFFNFNWRKVWCFSLLVVHSLLVVRTIIFLHLYLLCLVTGALHRLHHLLYAASTTAVSIVVRDSCLELCFFFLLSNGCNFQCSEVQYFSQNLLK